MAVDPGLQTLFILLRNAGIAVGLEEIRRLGVVFGTAPALDKDGFRQVIEAVVVKSVEQQAAFRRVFEQWLDAVTQQLKKSETRVEFRRKLRESGAAIPLPVMSDLSSPILDLVTPRSLPPMPAAPRMELDPEELPRGPIDPVPPKSGRAESQSDAQTQSSPHIELPIMAGEAAPHERTSSADLAQRTIAPGLPPRRTWQRVMNVVPLVVVVVSIALLWHYWSPGHGQQLDAGIDPVPPRPHDAGIGIRDADRRMVHDPVLEIVRFPGPPFNLLGHGLVVLSIALGAWLWLRRGRGRWLPVVRRAHEAPPAVVARAPVRVTSGNLLLDGQDEQNLVWGVDRFISDELSRELDVDLTARKTAAAYGRPVLCFESAQYQREVWLWVDESLESPAARHLARDLSRTLEASGLPVVRSTFWGIPYQLATQGEEIVTVDELDGRRDTAVVAVLTDGRLMSAANRARDRGDELRNLLRNLSFWPRVTFIDFGRGRGRLAPIVEPHGLRVIQPQDAAAAISEIAGDKARPEYDRLVGDARVWAAACALSPRPVDDPSALLLRQMLGLDVSPWAIEILRQSADNSAGGLSWSQQGRAALLSWLLDAEDLPEQGPPPPSSLLSRIVAGWDRLLDERERALRRNISPWEGSPAELQLRLERALVHLWDRPDEAAATLYELFQYSRLRPTIRHHLSQLAPREAADDSQSIPLPWSLRDRRRETQVALAEMRLGAHAGLGGRRSLPRPGRLLLAVGLCAGLSVGAATALLQDYLTRQPHQPELVNQWPEDKLPFIRKASAGKRQWLIEAWTPWSEQKTQLEVGFEQDYLLRGIPRWLPCMEAQEGMEIRRCCPDRERPVKPLPDRWSLAVIRPHNYASEVADELLCSGSIDVAYLLDDKAPDPDWSVWGHTKEDSQLLVLADAMPEGLEHYPGNIVVLALDSLGALLDVTSFEGTATLAELKPALEAMVGETDSFHIQGVGQCGEQEGQRCCAPAGAKRFVCRTGLECVDGKCQSERICQPGARRCEDGKVLQCNSQGTEEHTVICVAGEVCVDGQCEPRAGKPICTPGHVRCLPDGTTLVECTPDGTHETRTMCAPSGLCVREAGVCRPLASATVTFESLEVPPPRSALWKLEVACTVNGEERRWRALAQNPARPITVPFEPDPASQAIEVQCEIRSPQGVLDKRMQRYPWNRSAEGIHELVFERLPGMSLRYRLALALVSEHEQQGKRPDQVQPQKSDAPRRQGPRQRQASQRQAPPQPATPQQTETQTEAPGDKSAAPEAP